MTKADYAARAWRELGQLPAGQLVLFDPTTTEQLPGPARRLLLRALPDGTPLHAIVELEMLGGMRLGPKWLPFEATQILRCGVGFVWRPIVGGHFVRFIGADVLGASGALMEFRFHDRIPVVKASGPDVDKSAAGRLAAETVAWLPQALTPQVGATWTHVDDHAAIVGVATPSGPIDVEVSVSDDGRLEALKLQRWNNAANPPQDESFGGFVDGEYETDAGVLIAGSGTVGWHWDTIQRDEGVFFRYDITNARHVDPSPHPDGDRVDSVDSAA